MNRRRNKFERTNPTVSMAVFLFTAAGQSCFPNEIDLGCTCPLFERYSSRDASSDTGYHMTNQHCGPNSI